VLYSQVFSAASTDVERGFSRGGLVVTKLHHNLSDESTRAATVLHSCSQIPGFIPESEIIQMFATKSQRSGRSLEQVVVIED
jgi:hypothetical protein